MNTKRNKLYAILNILVTASLACGQLTVGIETPIPPTPLPGADPGDDTLNPGEVLELDSQTNDEPGTNREVSPYWTTIHDTRIGVRYAIPCFWIANIPTPEQDPSGLGSYDIRNFTSEFVDSFGPKRQGLIWENGALKIDFGPIEYTGNNLPPGSSPEDIANQWFGESASPGQGEVLTSTEEIAVNGQNGLMVYTYNKDRDSNGQLLILELNDDMAILFSAFTNENMNHPDILGIMNSMALSPDVEVNIPTYDPQDPPPGIAAPCLTGSEESLQPMPTAQVQPEGRLPLPTQKNSVEEVAYFVQNNILNDNPDGMLQYMADDFAYGGWASEWQDVTTAYVVNNIRLYELPANRENLTFYVDRAKFPPLTGITPENMLGPDVKVVLMVYSEGWMENGQGSALMFFAENPAGGYYWKGLLVSGQHFDR